MFIGNYDILDDVKKSVISGKVDASFVVLRSNNTMLNTIATTSYMLELTASTPAKNAQIHKVGQSTGLTSGSVKETSVSINLHNHTGQIVSITDIISASYNSAEGNSGGLAYSISGSKRYPVGIHVGSDRKGTAFVAKTMNVNLALGVARY